MKIKNKEKVINALLNTPTVVEAAKLCGLSEETIYRYLKDEEFSTEYRSARRLLFEQNIAKLQALHSDAVETLARNLNCENPSVEVRAAQIIIEGNHKNFETMDVIERLEILEDAIKKEN